MTKAHNLNGLNSLHLCIVLLLSILPINIFPGICFATDFWSQTNSTQTSSFQNLEDIFWSEPDRDDEFSLLSRQRRETNGTSGSKSVWQKIEEFYADKNNMAMFCVLPILITVYGGCSAIYCVHKCRQYIKRRKHKRLKDEDFHSVDTSKTDLESTNNNKEMNQDKDRPVSQISNAWTDLQVDAAGTGWSGQTEGKPLGSWSSSPLPWSVPSRNEATVTTIHSHNMSRVGYIDDSLKKDDIEMTEINRSSSCMSAKNRVSSPVSDKLLEDERCPEVPVNQEDVTQSQIPALQLLSAKTSCVNKQSPWEPRPLANLTEYATDRSTVAKAADCSRFSDSRSIEIIPLSADPNLRSTVAEAADCSRFSDSRSIEIIPLSADPNLRSWDPLHNRPFGRKDSSHVRLEITGLGVLSGHGDARPGSKSAQQMKEELLAKYDALSTFQMAKRAAEILNNGAVEKSKQTQKKPTKKKHIFITE